MKFWIRAWGVSLFWLFGVASGGAQVAHVPYCPTMLCDYSSGMDRVRIPNPVTPGHSVLEYASPRERLDCRCTDPEQEGIRSLSWFPNRSLPVERLGVVCRGATGTEFANRVFPGGTLGELLRFKQANRCQEPRGLVLTVDLLDQEGVAETPAQAAVSNAGRRKGSARMPAAQSTRPKH